MTENTITLQATLSLPPSLNQTQRQKVLQLFILKLDTTYRELGGNILETKLMTELAEAELEKPTGTPS